MADCTVTGTILWNTEPVSGISVYAITIIKNGEIQRSSRIRLATSDFNGLVTFDVPRLSTVYIHGHFKCGGTDFTPLEGVALSIPDSPTATLESLTSASAFTLTGLTVQANGSPLANLVGTINFSSAFEVTESPTGVALVDLADNPFPDYLTQIEGDARYDPLGLAAAEATARANADALLLVKTANLSDLSNVGTARTNLGLGSLSTVTPTGTPDGTKYLRDDFSWQTVLGYTDAQADARIAAARGVSIQAFDATLQSISALGTAADKLPYTTGVDTWAETALTAFGRSLIDDANAAAGRTTLGLGTIATQPETDYALLAGRAGGQSLSGGTAASENLTLQSTAHATKGYILLGTGGLVGVNKSSPGAQLHVVAKDISTKGIRVGMAASPTSTSYPFSIADSLDADLAYFDTAGRLLVPAGSVSAVGYGFSAAGGSNDGMFQAASGTVSLAADGEEVVRASSGGVNASVTVKAALGFYPNGGNAGSPDVYIFRDAADTLALRRGTNAQTFRLYNTFTDASNYERFSMGWSGNVFTLGNEGAGTGNLQRNVAIQGGSGTSKLLLVGNSPQLTITGNVGFVADNSYTIGSSGGSSPIDIYATRYIALRVGATSTGALIQSPSTGNIVLLDYGATSFGRLMFGGTTSSFPSIKRNATVLNFRLADDSADANITAGTITAGNSFDVGGVGKLTGTADGVWVLYNLAGTNVNRFNFGGTTASFPAIKRNSAALDLRLADDSAYANLNLGIVPTYNSIATAGLGLAGIYGNVDLSTQAAAIVTANAYASVPAGTYRITWIQTITRAATTSSSLQTTIGWTNSAGVAKTSTAWFDDSAGTTGTAADATNTLGSQRENSIIVSVGAATNITYAVAYASSGATTMQYALKVTVERIQ